MKKLMLTNMLNWMKRFVGIKMCLMMKGLLFFSVKEEESAETENKATPPQSSNASPSSSKESFEDPPGTRRLLDLYEETNEVDSLCFYVDDNSSCFCMFVETESF